MFNDTLVSINASLQASIRTATGDNTIDVPQAPILFYNSASERFELYLDSTTYGLTNKSYDKNGSSDTFGDTAGTIEFHSRLFFDSNIYALLDGFNFNYTGSDVANDNTLATDYLTYEIVPPKMSPLDELNVVEFGTEGNKKKYYKLIPNYSNLSSIWSPISSIVFETTVIPVVSEITGVDENKFGGTSTNLINYSKIITDIQLPGDAQQYRKKISYFSPSAGYRWIDLGKTGDRLRAIDFEVSYKLKNDGKIYSIDVLNGSHINILMKFKHKNI